MIANRFVLTMATAALACGVASAQNIKPGLWEMTQSMHGQSGGKDIGAAQAQAQRELAALPPEQRKMVEAMMAKQGMSMSAGGNTMRVCISKEMAERGQPPAGQGSDCKMEWSPRQGNTISTRFTCTNPPSSGEGTIVFSGSESYAMNMKVTQMRSGKPETMTMQSTSKWVGADCGNLKPLAPGK
ncbi:MAG: DUF3617 domain-containing protein [Burkholderiales bacterium]|nr:DUF3617 domain-containing protein [Burkholderiales bacterium]